MCRTHWSGPNRDHSTRVIIRRPGSRIRIVHSCSLLARGGHRNDGGPESHARSAGIFESPFGSRVYCAASNGTGWEALPSGGAQLTEIPRQKKAQPYGLRLRFHQRRRFWRSASPPVGRRHNEIIPELCPQCKRFLLPCNILWTFHENSIYINQLTRWHPPLSSARRGQVCAHG